MSVRVYQHDDDVYLTGAGSVPCMCWKKRAQTWHAAPGELPTGATSITVEQIPDELREELLAFVVRADAMGAASAPSGN